MTFDEIWKQLCKKQPGLTDPFAIVEFDSASLRRLLLQVYEKGRESAPKESGFECEPMISEIFKGKQ